MTAALATSPTAQLVWVSPFGSRVASALGRLPLTEAEAAAASRNAQPTVIYSGGRWTVEPS